MTRYFLDVETTGLTRTHAQGYALDAEPRIVSIAVVRGDGSVVGAQRLNPGVPIPEAASRVHGIRDEDVAHSPTFAQVWPRLLAKVGDAALVVAHARVHADAPRSSSQSSEFAASIRCARWTKTYRPSVQLREERPESA